VKAIELAGRLFVPGGEAKFSINFMPNAVYEPEACIRVSLAAARRVGLDPGRLMFEFTEDERMQDVAHVRHIIEAYRARGFTTAIDDFGAGYAGLGLLADLHPDMLKLDMALIRGIDGSASRRTIVAGDVTPVFHPAATRDRPLLSRRSAGEATGGFKPARCFSSSAANDAGVA
jgi:EAL domain-containing protein (putative c-di-GMP-specific phosphodiesterase class I)